jgi:CubicO group peptidase (beta-lactamase class C family)
MAAFFGLLSNCPDLARFGLLYLNRGAWNGQQLLSKDWVLSSLTPSPLNPRYGYLWWLDDPATPLLPADSFAARGARGQQILVVPSKGIVITRMASMSTGERQPDEIGSAVLAALTK